MRTTIVLSIEHSKEVPDLIAKAENGVDDVVSKSLVDLPVIDFPTLEFPVLDGMGVRE